MADIGVMPHVIEAALNHISGHKGGVAGIYNRSAYAPEVREALTRWSEHLLGVVGGAAANRKRASMTRKKENSRAAIKAWLDSNLLRRNNSYRN